MAIIKPRDAEERVMRSFRLKKSLDNKLNDITKKIGESKVYVLESLLEYAIKEWEKTEGKSIVKSE